MDNLTHGLVGALIGQAGLKRRTGLAMPALILGANLPDVDAACFLWLDGVEHLGFRRGITHGPPAWILLPLLLAGALWWFDRWQAKRGTRPEGRLPVHFVWLYGLSFLACLTHPALDWLNVYGIRLLEPFTSRWFYGDTLFIIDVWLWLGMGFATVLSLRREKRGREWRLPARVGLVAASLYVGANMLISQAALRTMGMSHSSAAVIALPVPAIFWERELLFEADGVIFQGPAIQPWHLLKGQTGPRQLLLPGGPSCLAPGDLLRFSDDPALRAFLFWSRAPFVVRAPAGGEAVLRDARYASPMVGDRFSVRVPVPPEAENCGFE